MITRVDITYYVTRDHALEAVGPVLPGGLATSFDRQPWGEAACAVIVLSAVLARTPGKIRAARVRLRLQEAVYAAQNICLLDGEHGLSTVCLGGFIDSRLNAAGRTEAALYAVAVGHRTAAG